MHLRRDIDSVYTGVPPAQAYHQQGTPHKHEPSVVLVLALEVRWIGGRVAVRRASDWPEASVTPPSRRIRAQGLWE